MGEITGHEEIRGISGKSEGEARFRTQLKIGNRDLYGLDFQMDR